jgi:hypothetical protein
MGRITPTEAERLLVVWNDGREGVWLLAACIAIASLAQLHPRAWVPWLAHIAHSLLPGSHASLHHAVSLLTCLLGGIL